MTRFAFAFSRAYRVAGLPFGVTPRTAWAAIDEDQLFVHFGPWRLRTALGNIAQATTSGGFAFLKTAGPAHLSLADRGVTFATNGDRAVCLQFHTPVTAIDPMGLLTHPNATLTPSDREAFLLALGGDHPPVS
ncbi:hypothetical protein [Janibacter cremeus]|uniref:Uncharacterized protein n=1 Tax=Janibacter cremeus TaxID=1285192 RepID=A0A852VVJ4_9MICO|nr:hypothetical protein [Janibacter cremeus]NYF97795.1 hypothetical protein [Janibacter cremeus]